MDSRLQFGTLKKRNHLGGNELSDSSGVLMIRNGKIVRLRRARPRGKWVWSSFFLAVCWQRGLDRFLSSSLEESLWTLRASG